MVPALNESFWAEHLSFIHLHVRASPQIPEHRSRALLFSNPQAAEGAQSSVVWGLRGARGMQPPHSCLPGHSWCASRMRGGSCMASIASSFQAEEREAPEGRADLPLTLLPEAPEALLVRLLPRGVRLPTRTEPDDPGPSPPSLYAVRTDRI